MALVIMAKLDQLTSYGNTDIAVNQQKGCETEVICNLALTPENFRPVKPRLSHRTRAPIQPPLTCLGLRGVFHSSYSVLCGNAGLPSLKKPIKLRLVPTHNQWLGF
jgi:hypothetical protein